MCGAVFVMCRAAVRGAPQQDAAATDQRGRHQQARSQPHAQAQRSVQVRGTQVSAERCMGDTRRGSAETSCARGTTGPVKTKLFHGRNVAPSVFAVA
jgi:hypothetical protein